MKKEATTTKKDIEVNRWVSHDSNTLDEKEEVTTTKKGDTGEK